MQNLLKKQNKAFTLVEVMIAISILSLIMLTVHEFFIRGIVIFRKGTDKLGTSHETSIILEKMKSELKESFRNFSVENNQPPTPVSRNNILKFTKFILDESGIPKINGSMFEEEFVEYIFEKDKGIIYRKSGRDKSIIGKNILSVNFSLLNFTRGKSGIFPTIMIELAASINRQYTEFRTVVVPRFPVETVNNPGWIMNLTGNSFHYNR